MTAENGGLTAADVEALINSKLAEKDSQISDLMGRLEAAEARAATAERGVPLTLVPEHGAGPGTSVEETWCQAWQTRAVAEAG